MRSYRYVVASAAVALLLGQPAKTAAQTPGNAQSFAIVGGQSVAANGAGSTINGNVGINPAAATNITGIPANATITPPFVNHGNNGVAIAASASVLTLFNSPELALAGGTPGTPTPANLLLGGNGAGVYVPGKYTVAVGTALIPAGGITLDGPGTYIFSVNSDLTTIAGTTVNLINGANACNVFWRVPTQATIGGATFRGTIVSNALIALGVGAQVTGRALTTANGSVTLAGGNSIGGCSAGAPAVICPITFTPNVLANGTVGAAYSQTFAGTGVAPVTFTVPPGTMPAGLSLSAAGVLSGTPITAETQTFGVTGTDAVGCSLSRSFTVVITSGGTPPAPGCPVITLSPASIPNGAVGVAYEQTITAVGAVTAVTFTRTAGDLLPPGLTLSSSGTISGTPTAIATSTFTIRATQTNGCIAELPYLMSILAGVPTLPQVFVWLLALTLIYLGYRQLRRRGEHQTIA